MAAGLGVRTRSSRPPPARPREALPALSRCSPPSVARPWRSWPRRASRVLGAAKVKAPAAALRSLDPQRRGGSGGSGGPQPASLQSQRRGYGASFRHLIRRQG